MDLRSHEPFWPLKNGLIKNYPSLSTDAKADVCIVGAGITGALVAWHLAKAGLDVVVVDKRHVGAGSSSASTALLQYEIDTPLYKLKELVGEKNAAQSYLLCLKAIHDMATICDRLEPTGFELKPSFQYASFKKDVAPLRQELALRKKYGISLDWLTTQDIKDQYGFAAPGGILSRDGAQVDAYKLTHALLAQAARKWGIRVFDNTSIESLVHTRRSVTATSDRKHKIKARYLVMASGYESQNYLPKKVEEFNSTYAIISEPVPQKKLWYKNSLIWETATPYLYMRTTEDNRIIIGGKDDDFSSPLLRNKKVAEKARQLKAAFSALFPRIPFNTDYQWAGTFASTKDGLPYIGTVPQLPSTYLALGFGGNGITFSILAAQIIRDALLGKPNKATGLFPFDR